MMKSFLLYSLIALAGCFIVFYLLTGFGDIGRVQCRTLEQTPTKVKLASAIVATTNVSLTGNIPAAVDATVPPQAERMGMSVVKRLALLEQLGQVPDDPHPSEWRLAEKTSWWGKRLDPVAFWTNRVVWYDQDTEFEARRRGRGVPPIPPNAIVLSPRDDTDRRATGMGIEYRSPRFVSSARERAYWEKFRLSSPHPSKEIDDWIAVEAEAWLRKKHTIETDSEYAARLRLRPKELAESLDTDLRDAKLFFYPTECVSPESYMWDHVMRKRKEYEALMNGPEADSKITQNLFWDRVYVDHSLITKPLLPDLITEQFKAANAWKVAYLKRLRVEKWDESYITAYKEAWSLTEHDLAESDGTQE